MDLMTYLLAIQKIQEVSSDTTYTLTADVQNKTIVLTPSVGTAQVITVPYATDASTVNGKDVPELENGKIPATYLPSYVDDVEEYEDQAHFPSTGESNKIYIDLTTNKIYRWSGSTYVEISESLALGETSSTAFRGDHGKAAYDHSVITSGNPHNVTKTDIGLENVGNFKAVSTAASQGLTDTEQENAKTNIGLGSAADKNIDTSIEESSQSTNLPTTKAVSDFVQTQTDKAIGTVETISNLPADIISFSEAGALPMPKLEVAIEPVQSGSGDPSPENIRPISGWTEANVSDVGKNLFDKTTNVLNAYIDNSILSSDSAKTVYCKCKPNTTYTVSKTAGQRFAVGTTEATPQVSVPVKNKITNNTSTSISITTDASAKYIVAYVWNGGADSITSSQMLDSVQIEVGSQPSSYTPYNPNSQKYTIDLDGTRYGGKVDLVSGVLTVDRGYALYKGEASENIIAYSAQTYRFTLALTNYKSPSQSVADVNLKSNIFKTYSKNQLINQSMGICAYDEGGSACIIKVEGITTVEDIKTWLSTHNLQVMYPLATPITIQLTPTMVKSLLGQNNVWADTGAILDAEYIKDSTTILSNLGGGAGGVIRETIYEAPNGGGTWMDATGKLIDLSKDIDNYDEIEVIALTTEGDNNFYYTGSQKFVVADLLVPRTDTVNKGMPFRVLVYRSTGLDSAALSVVLVSQDASETAKRTLYCNGATGIYGPAIHAIYGIKY